MKLHYYPETDSLYIELRSGPSTETREIANGLNAGNKCGGDGAHARDHDAEFAFGGLDGSGLARGGGSGTLDFGSCRAFL